MRKTRKQLFAEHDDRMRATLSRLDEPRESTVPPTIAPMRPKVKKTFVQLYAETQNKDNWRPQPSSRFRWLSLSINRHQLGLAVVGGPRFWRSKELAETFAKSMFRTYTVAYVKGFL